MTEGAPAADELRLARSMTEALVPRWVPFLFAVLALALVGGIVKVSLGAPTLPLAQHWRLAWGGFDVGLAVLLAATGLALLKRSPVAEVLAAMTATLLVCDAWLDVLSSLSDGRIATAEAIVEALLAEIPLALLFGSVSVRYARLVSRARPSLIGAGFVVHHRRLHEPEHPKPLGVLEEHLVPRWLPRTSLVLALLLVPWIAFLFATLPEVQTAQRWTLIRVGLMIALALLLAAAAIALLARWPIAEVLVAMAGAFLLRDAWFNVLTSERGHEVLPLVVTAAIEIPLAALCLWVAFVYERAVQVAWPHLGCEPANNGETT